MPRSVTLRTTLCPPRHPEPAREAGAVEPAALAATGAPEDGILLCVVTAFQKAGITANMALPTGGVVVGERIQLVIEVEASLKTQ